MLSVITRQPPDAWIANTSVMDWSKHTLVEKRVPAVGQV